MLKSVLFSSSVFAALSLTGVAAEAKVSTEAELRGYQQCLNAAARESNGLVPTRNYYIDKEDAQTEYFINATRWENGERAYVRINCTTTARGERLLSADIDSGMYRNEPVPSVRVELASQ